MAADCKHRQAGRQQAGSRQAGRKPSEAAAAASSGVVLRATVALRYRRVCCDFTDKCIPPTAVRTCSSFLILLPTKAAWSIAVHRQQSVQSAAAKIALAKGKEKRKLVLYSTNST